jgi:hypothetical protein
MLAAAICPWCPFHSGSPAWPAALSKWLRALGVSYGQQQKVIQMPLVWPEELQNTKRTDNTLHSQTVCHRLCCQSDNIENC